MSMATPHTTGNPYYRAELCHAYYGALCKVRATVCHSTSYTQNALIRAFLPESGPGTDGVVLQPVEEHGWYIYRICDTLRRTITPVQPDEADSTEHQHTKKLLHGVRECNKVPAAELSVPCGPGRG
jgi:hypothetical protein